MDMIFDFWGYFIPPWSFVIKEFCLVNLPKFSSAKILVNGIFTPPCKWDELPEFFKNEYNEKLNKYGIEWDFGYLNVKYQTEILLAHLNQAKYVYVKDLEIKKYLKLIMPYCRNEFIICLNDIGYHEPDLCKTSCCDHKIINHSYCIIEAAKSMRDWLLNNWPTFKRKEGAFLDEDRFIKRIKNN